MPCVIVIMHWFFYINIYSAHSINYIFNRIIMNHYIFINFYPKSVLDGINCHIKPANRMCRINLVHTVISR